MTTVTGQPGPPDVKILGHSHEHDNSTSINEMNEEDVNDDSDEDDENHFEDRHQIGHPVDLLNLFGSGFSSLTSIYTILVSLAISSSSAARVMSKVKILKSRLRTTMRDDWF